MQSFDHEERFTADGRPCFYNDEPGAPEFVIRVGDFVSLRGREALVETVDGPSRLARLQGMARTQFVNWEKLTILRGVGETEDSRLSDRAQAAAELAAQKEAEVQARIDQAVAAALASSVEAAKDKPKK